MASTLFRPDIHGFRFPNRFVNVVARLPRGAKLTTNGRCGGMSFAALDYFTAGVATPTQTDLPTDGDALGRYLLQRQLESFLTNTAVRFVWWTLMPDVGDGVIPGVAGLTRTQELPRLRARIDAGETVVLGMIAAHRWQDVGRRNHQVVAYGYRDDAAGNTDVSIYDPNTPGAETILTVAPDGNGVGADNRDEPWRGFFVHTYVAAQPPG